MRLTHYTRPLVFTLLVGIAMLAALPVIAQDPAQGDDARKTIEIDGLTYDVPEGWVVEEPAQSSFIRRLAQIRLPNAEGEEGVVQMVVTQAGGGIDANIGRWRGQFTGGQNGNDADPTRFEVAGRRCHVVELHGTYSVPPFMRRGGGPAQLEDHAMIGAILEGRGNATFFKILGSEATVVAQRDAIHAFLKSGRRADGGDGDGGDGGGGDGDGGDGDGDDGMDDDGMGG